MFKGGWTSYRQQEYGPRRFGSVVRTDRSWRHNRSTGELVGIYGQVQQDLRQLVPKSRGRLRSYQDVSYLQSLIASARREAEVSNLSVNWLRALALQAPHAAQAQRQMDAHPHGFRNKSVRTMELIDFNDAFVSVVLALSPEERISAVDDIRSLMDWFCKRVGVKSFSDDQFNGIVKGLSREVAVYYGALNEGFKARLTGRHDDAMGIDLIVTDVNSGKLINIDCKTPSAFRHRLGDLFFEGRITDDERLKADQDGYAIEQNGHDADRVEVVLLRIDRESYGEVMNFEFTNSETLGAILKMLINNHGQQTGQTT